METNTFTIFTKYPSGYKGFLVRRGSLDDCIEETAGFEMQTEGGLATPVAWDCPRHGVRMSLAESLAAGRTIELIDGKFVARGVEDSESPAPVDDLVKRITPENCHADAWEPKPTQTLGDVLRQALERGLSGVKQPVASPDANARMIARDGIAKPVAIRGTPAPCPSYGQCTYPECSHFLDVSKNAAKPAPSFLTYSPDLQPSSHQVGPAFGSALLRG